MDTRFDRTTRAAAPEPGRSRRCHQDPLGSKHEQISSESRINYRKNFGRPLRRLLRTLDTTRLWRMGSRATPRTEHCCGIYWTNASNSAWTKCAQSLLSLHAGGMGQRIRHRRRTPSGVARAEPASIFAYCRLHHSRQRRLPTYGSGSWSHPAPQPRHRLWELRRRVSSQQLVEECPAKVGLRLQPSSIARTDLRERRCWKFPHSPP
jgi:hypothetical protein